MINFKGHALHPQMCQTFEFCRSCFSVVLLIHTSLGHFKLHTAETAGIGLCRHVVTRTKPERAWHKIKPMRFFLKAVKIIIKKKAEWFRQHLIGFWFWNVRSIVFVIEIKSRFTVQPLHQPSITVMIWTWELCRNWVDHESLCIPKFSRLKCAAASPTAKTCPKLCHATRQWSNTQQQICNKKKTNQSFAMAQ